MILSNKKTVLAGIFACILFFCLSCKSSSYWEQEFIPGQEDTILTNIASEYFSIAELYADLGKYQKAIEYYKKAIRNKELFPMAYYKLGIAYALSSDWNNAIIVFEAIYKNDGKNTSIGQTLAYVYARQGKIDESIALYEKLISESGYSPEILNNYISVLILIDRIDDAEKQFEVFKTKFQDDERIQTIQEKITKYKESKEPAVPIATAEHVENPDDQEKL